MIDWKLAYACSVSRRRNERELKEWNDSQEKTNYCAFCGNQLCKEMQLFLFSKYKNKFVKICNHCYLLANQETLLYELWISFSEVTLKKEICNICNGTTKYFVQYHSGPCDRSSIDKKLVCSNCFFQNYTNEKMIQDYIEHDYSKRKNKLIMDRVWCGLILLIFFGIIIGFTVWKFLPERDSGWGF